jgi:hypothetical protein
MGDDGGSAILGGIRSTRCRHRYALANRRSE